MLEKMDNTFEAATAERVRAHLELEDDEALERLIRNVEEGLDSDITLELGWERPQQVEIARQILEERKEKTA